MGLSDAGVHARETVASHLRLPGDAVELRPSEGQGGEIRNRWLHRASVGLIVLWCAWWGVSLARHEMVGVTHSWFTGCFGVDFEWHVDRPTRIWLAGGDAYEDKIRACLYPPAVMRMFAWVGLMTPAQALNSWICVAGLLAAGCGAAAWRCRRTLGLNGLPVTAVVAAFLFCTPMTMTLERGQFDLFTAPLVIVAVALMRRETRWSQILAGGLLVLAPWAKVYPGLLGVGLAGLGRWRALASFVVVGVAIGAATPAETARFVANLKMHTSEVKALRKTAAGSVIHPWNHAFADSWDRIWRGTPLNILRVANGKIAAALVLGSLLVWVSLRVSRCRQREALAFPYLIWVVAVAAFVPTSANAYNLVFLPLAVLCVTSRRDPLPCLLAIGAFAIWWQPVALPIGGVILFVFKFAALCSAGVSLTRRAQELNVALTASSEVSRIVCEPTRLAA